MLKYLIYFNVFILTTSSSQVKYPCRDEKNQPVDWYALYKLPRIKGHENNLVHQGKAYAYITSKENTGHWILSEKPITDANSIPGLTLAPIYKKPAESELFYMLYNDQIPDTKSSFAKGGHAKGAVAGGENGGFWLVHSVPRYAGYPSNSTNHKYPPNGFYNGQSFLCMTLDSMNLNKAGEGLFYNDIHVYAKNLPESLKSKYPELYQVADGDHVKVQPFDHQVNINSASGKMFKVFAKSEKWHKDLYIEKVAPDLKVDLLLQTWPNNRRSHQHSSCSTAKKVENIEKFKISGIEFANNIDHSKWAASKSKNEPWVCVGDINLDLSQQHRGGGTVCTENLKMWEAYHDSVIKVEKC